jgi:hypothetical protein
MMRERVPPYPGLCPEDSPQRQEALPARRRESHAWEVSDVTHQRLAAVAGSLPKELGFLRADVIRARHDVRREATWCKGTTVRLGWTRFGHLPVLHAPGATHPTQVPLLDHIAGENRQKALQTRRQRPILLGHAHTMSPSLISKFLPGDYREDPSAQSQHVLTAEPTLYYTALTQTSQGDPNYRFSPAYATTPVASASASRNSLIASLPKRLSKSTRSASA